MCPLFAGDFIPLGNASLLCTANKSTFQRVAPTEEQPPEPFMGTLIVTGLDLLLEYYSLSLSACSVMKVKFQVRQWDTDTSNWKSV